MSDVITRTSLEAKLETLTAPDRERNAILDGSTTVPPGERALSEHEQALIDWGIYYGVAVGIARAEDPWEPIESVVKRAVEAAEPRFSRYIGATV